MVTASLDRVPPRGPPFDPLSTLRTLRAWRVVSKVVVRTSLVTILAVIVGALVSGGVQLYIEMRRDRRADSKAKLVVARLVSAELSTAHSAMTFAILEGSWWWEDIPTDHWSEQSGVLAGFLSAEDWQAVRDAYQEIERGERTRRQRGTLTTSLATGLPAGAQRVARALYALAPYALGMKESEVPSGAQAAIAAAALEGAPAVPQESPDASS